MNKKYLFIYLLICLLVISCVSLPESDNANQTLVVGMINMQFIAKSVAGIEICLQEFTSNKLYILRSGSGGLFYSIKVPQGTYKITRINFTNPNRIITIRNPPRIEIENGKVNNFGTINGIEDIKNKWINISWDSGYEQTRDFFREKYSSSNWNEREWINIGFNNRNSGSSIGWLGVNYRSGDSETLQALGITGQQGTLVTSIYMNSPADKGGIRPGDFITHVNRKEVRDAIARGNIIGDLKPGDNAIFTVIRDGASRDIQVRIEGSNNAYDRKKLWPGFDIMPLNDKLKESLKLNKDAKGLYVVGVASDSPADIIGIKQGDLVTALNGENIKDIRDFYRLLREKTDKELRLTYIRGNATLASSTYNRLAEAPVLAQSVPAAPAQSPVPVPQQKIPAPQKFALVIGNGTYKNLSRLANPVNDANDMAAALQSMGFVVDKLIDASQEQIDSAVTRLKNRLSVSANSYGFFFYAGHGVQSNGENFLIPVDANIPGENYLRGRAVSVQVMLDELNDARNELNVMVLDACRDNPFGWARSGSRGLAVLGRQPADSIIVYATSAGSAASDGTSRNGLFTSQLLKNLTTPGLEINEIFRRTGADVRTVSNGQQIPAIYSQFFGTVILKN